MKTTLTFLTERKTPANGRPFWSARLPNGLHGGRGRNEAEAVGNLFLSMAQVGRLLLSLPSKRPCLVVIVKGGAA